MLNFHPTEPFHPEIKSQISYDTEIQHEGHTVNKKTGFPKGWDMRSKRQQ
jgi:hypothetical protein